MKQAYRNLMSLAEERIRFLSTRRCRHFLAAIAPQLLAAIAATADPDSTLVNLDQVSDSLGGKGVLWELFSFNPPSLRLYVELCAYSPYLSGILTSNPGMIDSLMDSLVLDKLPTRENMRAAAGRAVPRGRRHRPDPAQLQERPAALRRRARHPGQGRHPGHDRRAVGHRRDLPGADRRAGVRAAGRPASASRTIAEGRRAGQPCEMVILALGKFGGREMNYHSDLDVIFLYEADGHTAAAAGSAARQSTTNQHFFSELGQRIIKTASRLSGYGRLYEVDARLRPTGKSGTLATTFDEFARYFAGGGGQLWERQALCKARVVYGSPRAAKAAMAAVAKAAFAHRWRRKDAAEIRQMRQRLEETAAGRRRPETRPRRHRRHRVPRADAATQARPRQSRPPRAQHAGGARRAVPGRACCRSTTTSSSTPATGCCGRSRAGCG